MEKRMKFWQNWLYFWEKGEKKFIPEGPWPKGIIFCFHGLTQSTGNIRRYSKMEEIGQKLNCVVIFPQSDGYMGNWLSTPFSVFDQKLNAFKQSYQLDNRLFLVGFSNGACYVHRLGQHWQAQISAVCIYAGALLGYGVSTGFKYPVLGLHSKNDPLVSETDLIPDYRPSFAERGSMMGELVQAYKSAGHPTEYIEFDTGGHVWRADKANTHILSMFGGVK